MRFQGLNILIISPSKWGKMYISKHNYAIELAKAGNNVYYLEPALKNNQEKWVIETPLASIAQLKVIRFRIPFIVELLRFKVRSVYNIIMSYYVKNKFSKLNTSFDIVWCFETNLYANLRIFNGKITIYHPVDLLPYTYQRKIARTADVVLAVSDTIVKEVEPFNANVHFINHGLNDVFRQNAEKILNTIVSGNTPKNDTQKIRAGFVGNLFRPELNRSFFTEAIEKYPDVLFHLWGPSSISDSNIDGENSMETKTFIAKLQAASNVFLHGVQAATDIANEITHCDILILAVHNSSIYDCSNSHKIIEYLSTGNIIVSNKVSTYENTDLFEMANDDSAASLLQVFENVLNNISKYNSLQKKEMRIHFALENTYQNHIRNIEKLINNK